MFPFRWQLTYVPVLPLALLELLEAPGTFIMGCHASHKHFIDQVCLVFMYLYLVSSWVLRILDTVSILPYFSVKILLLKLTMDIHYDVSQWKWWVKFDVEVIAWINEQHKQDWLSVEERPFTNNTHRCAQCWRKPEWPPPFSRDYSNWPSIFWWLFSRHRLKQQPSLSTKVQKFS